MSEIFVLPFRNELNFIAYFGLMVKASASRGAELGSVPTVALDLCPGRVMPVTSKLVIQRLPCQASGDTGSALGVVGPVSVFCDRVR